jgi:hypothetical protein
MPHKYNADRRHRIPKRRYKVPNWQAYEAGLRQRGSLTIWFTEEAITAWQPAANLTMPPDIAHEPPDVSPYSSQSSIPLSTQRHASSANGF